MKRQAMHYFSRIAITLAILQLFYCILLINGFYFVELFLPYIYLLSWAKLIEELAQFEIVRKFLIIFKQTAKSLVGFMIFFVLILASFATTESIIRKSLFRFKKTSKASGPYSKETYANSGAFVENEKIFGGLISSI
jgi:hypothetical protein